MHFLALLETFILTQSCLDLFRALCLCMAWQYRLFLLLFLLFGTKGGHHCTKQNSLFQVVLINCHDLREIASKCVRCCHSACEDTPSPPKVNLNADVLSLAQLRLILALNVGYLFFLSMEKNCFSFYLKLKRLQLKEATFPSTVKQQMCHNFKHVNIPAVAFEHPKTEAPNSALLKKPYFHKVLSIYTNETLKSFKLEAENYLSLLKFRLEGLIQHSRGTII